MTYQSDNFEKTLNTLFSDDHAHIIHQTLWGGVDPYGHNRDEDGSPFGDCYKCRIIRDAVHDALRKFASAEQRGGAAEV